MLVTLQELRVLKEGLRLLHERTPMYRKVPDSDGESTYHAYFGGVGTPPRRDKVNNPVYETIVGLMARLIHEEDQLAVTEVTEGKREMSLEGRTQYRKGYEGHCMICDFLMEEHDPEGYCPEKMRLRGGTTK